MTARVGYSILAVFITAVLAVFFWVWGLNIVHFFTSQARELLPVMSMITLAVVALIVAFFADKNAALRGAAVLVTIVSIILAIVFWCTAEFNRLNTYYSESVTYVDNTYADSYRERAPYEVADRTSDASLMNTTGEALTTKSLSEQGDHGEWNALVLTRGPFNGYESVQNSSVPLFGTAPNSNIKFCDFDQNNTLRHSGAMPHNNLSRAIYGQVPLDVDWDSNDAYGYCNEEGEPVVVTPLKQITGFWGVWRYYGVAIYNGTTGDLSILTDKEDIEEIPGPVYPMSLAATQRVALTASENPWEFLFVRAAGYETATNNTEVQLTRTDVEEGSAYITTLRPRGSSTSIVAVSQIDSFTGEQGKLNQVKVAVLPTENTRASNQNLVNDIQTLYSYMPEFANDSLQVYEITAGDDGSWVASMGREQAVNYRAYVDKEGKIELKDRNGNVIAQNGGGSNNGSTGEGDEGGLVPTELSTLSNQELKELNNLITDELIRRAEASAQ